MAKVPNILKLRIKWSKQEKDFMVYYPRSCDGHFVNSAFLSKRLIGLMSKVDSDNEPYYKKAYSEGNRSYYEWDIFLDLKNRGYDLTTFKMEICIDKKSLADKFSHLWDELSEKEKTEVLNMGFLAPKENNE